MHSYSTKNGEINSMYIIQVGNSVYSQCDHIYLFDGAILNWHLLLIAYNRGMCGMH